MDWQTYFNIGLAAAFTSIGWFAKQLWYAVNQLKTDLKMLEVKLPSEYVRKGDLSEILRRIDSTLERIEKKLDAKADK
jgi:hypothetical protein